MDMENLAPVRRSRKGLYVPLVVFGLLCAGWAGFWFFARDKATDLMDAWMAREARLGRLWSCPDRAIGGFPFRVELSCVSPTFASTEPGRAGNGSLAGLAVTARAVDPKQIIAVFAGPLKWTALTGETVELSFANARASYRGLPSSIEDMSMELDQPVLQIIATGIAPQKVTATRTEFHLRRAPGAEIATDIAMSSSNMVSPLIDQMLGDASPGNFDVRARLTNFAPAPPRDWRETLENWRRADGEAKFEKISFTKGPLALNVTGVVRLDENRRPEGDINGSAQGVNVLLRAFGINADSGGAAGLLGALLGGGRPAQPGSAKALPFSLRMDQGRMYIGPFPGPRLRSLY